MRTDEALDVLRRHATGQLDHAWGGACPSAADGPDTRDPDCEVCQALVALHADGPLREEIAPDEATMAAVEPATYGVTPPPGWTREQWLDRYGGRAMVAGIVAAANLERAGRQPLSRDAHAEPDDELLDACRTHAKLYLDGGASAAVLEPAEVATNVLRSSWLARRDAEQQRLGAATALHEFGAYADGIWSVRPYPGDRARAWRDALVDGALPWRRGEHLPHIRRS